MNKKILIIAVIILIIIVLLYFLIPIGQNIKISIQHNIPAHSSDGGKTVDPAVMAPSNYIITKWGFVYNAGSSFEKKSIKKVLNLFQKIKLQQNKLNEKFIYELLDIQKTSNMVMTIFKY